MKKLQKVDIFFRADSSIRFEIKEILNQPFSLDCLILTVYLFFRKKRLNLSLNLISFQSQP
ncbi:MAG: hypothetical protein DYG83_05985 [Candidatus Brocadia sp. AMX2]|nr:MAG: hypothetical protein EDM70_13335 [Candidatus Brocadia sp. AMX2]MBC6932016.1 hypothetical protein [Candidatus Brocadia sp.]MBL1169469.1 hypothetical protein [Candidatus Brocadia sp. AMX1]MCE7866367.1 hypothetical protein [Candidatus Brocadia sp. AMX2]MCQ3917102.1 hypothetical protein [Candidatus Brocadia sp.]